MADPVVPTPEFAPSFRGYDRTQVDRWVVKVRDRLKEVEGELSRLRNVVSDTAVHPVPEYERIGREIGALLQEADRLATSIREKAATEVEMWRADAEREAKSLRDAAAADAEAMRGDAWATSTELLEESQGRAARMVGDAEDNARGIRAEAERESHRLVAGARREADEQIRVAKMEAERVVSEALAEKDEIVESARRTAEAAQERARALEVRRDELLGELESVRATVQRLEEDIDEKRQLLEPDPEPEPSPSEPTWGGGVRVIPARDEPEAAEDFGEPVETMAVVEEVIRLREPEAGGGHVAVVATEPEPEPEPEPGPGPERETETDPEPEPELETDPEPETERELKPDLAPAAESGDELSALFSSLRGADEVEANEEVVAEESSGSAVGGPTPPAARERSSAGSDRLGDVEAAVEVRQRAVLPISNGALRGVKRELADAQNGALEALRTTQDWAPSQSELADRFEPILSSVRSDAFAAGWASAGGPGEPVGTPSNDRSAFAGDLVGSLVRALGKGADASAKSTEVSRAFRGWRSDSSERHLRAEAVLAFNEGVRSAIAASGTGAGIAVRSRGCSACRAAAEEGLGAVPPFHADCSCVVVPA